MNIVDSTKSGDYDAYIKEIERMHKGRLSRSLTRKTTSSGIIDSAGQDQSYRSRAVEILMTVTKRTVMLESAYDLTKAHVFNKYAEELARYKTKGERDQVVRNLLGGAKETLTKLGLVDKLCNLLIGDVDKAIWPLRYALERRQTAQKREGSF